MDRKQVLSSAMEIVCKDRVQAYGSPEDNFALIAEFWSAYMCHEVSAKDVAAMMALLKIARIATGTDKADNWIDLAGYAACGGGLNTSHMDTKLHTSVATSEGQVYSVNAWGEEESPKTTEKVNTR